MEHLEAMDLRQLSWHNVEMYTTATRIPIDCAFVACLDFLPELHTIVTEIGGRVIEV